jgi:uracil-DNA glycosylase
MAGYSCEPEPVVISILPAHHPLDTLLAEVRACRVCEAHLPLGPRPVLQAGADARILIVGQAPGARVHASGVPWDDRSGERLRAWMGIDAPRFYDASAVAIVPMCLCYPGRAASGDSQPRRECAPLWLDRLLAELPRVELTLLVGAHAQAHFLRATGHTSLTNTTRNWRSHLPRVLPLPHPSPRNIAWFKANPWFDDELLPVLQRNVRRLIGG